MMENFIFSADLRPNSTELQKKSVQSFDYTDSYKILSFFTSPPQNRRLGHRRWDSTGSADRLGSRHRH